MASWAVRETSRRVADQPGACPKKWDKAELTRCGATGTEHVGMPDLDGEIHPIFANWIPTRPELLVELEQPMLLASKLIEAAGLPWLSDFSADDIFDEDYPGRNKLHSRYFGQFDRTLVPRCIVRHHRASWASEDQKRRWRDSTRNDTRVGLPKLIQWQLDTEIFAKNGWNGYTCRHPRGDLPLGELDNFETIEKFDSICLHEQSRNLTILLTSEFPVRLAELRRQGKADGEEYLLTAFMTAVTLLHELGHAIYWKDRRSLTRGLREPFYGADLEMELGDSFVAEIFGGWTPVPVREVSKLREHFTFRDGLAWRQALSWDYHRIRPKFRACYSIPVEYVAKLFSEASWSESRDATTLIRPRLLTGESAALRTVGLYTLLTLTNRHATAAIADFHCEGDDWVWTRRPGACFRIPQFAGAVYPDIELPTATEDVVCEPPARVPREGRRVPKSKDSPTEDHGRTGKRQDEVRIRGGGEGGGDAPPVIPDVRTEARSMKLSPRKSEYSPRKFALVTPTKIPRPASSSTGSPSARLSLIASPRQRDSSGGASILVSPKQTEQAQQQRPRGGQETRVSREDQQSQKLKPHGEGPSGARRSEKHDNDDIPRVRLLTPERSEISVDELKKRLSQLIGVSLTEMEKMFDAPQEAVRT